VNNQPTSDPTRVAELLWTLITEVKSWRKTMFPLKLAFDFHLRYEQIHPFTNGNGRTGRLLMDKILIQNWFLPMIVFKDNKDAYFNVIQKASESEIWLKKYYTFMVEQYGKSVEKMLNFISLS
jgi:Fic family protein